LRKEVYVYRVILFFICLSLIYADVDYIDYEDGYEGEAYDTVYAPAERLPEQDSTQQKLKQLDKKIRLLEEKIREMEKGKRYLSDKVITRRKKVIYLTFDDGPLSGTRNILKVLEKERVKATFFLVGKHIEKEYALFKILRHSPYAFIANHTYSHASGRYRQFYRNPETVLTDINRAQRLIGGERYHRLAGRNVWRLPHYKCNDPALKRYVRRREIKCYNRVADAGYLIYGWDVEWCFDRRTGKALWDAESMFKKIVFCEKYGKSAQSGKVVLLAHDFMFRNFLKCNIQLSKLIYMLKKEGWQFDTIDNYCHDSPETTAVQEIREN